jgi:hypothetical protein
MHYSVEKVNNKHTWTQEKDCLLKRSHITRDARDRFKDTDQTADIIDPFLIAFNAHVLAPDYVKGKDNRTKYARAAVRKWARQFGIALSESDIDRINSETPLHRPTGEELGQMLGLTYERREKLKLWSIKPADVTEDEFEDMKREKARIRQARFRRRSGDRTRQQYRADIKSQKPWKTLGISKATYYRRQKAVRLGLSRDTTYNKKALRTESHAVNPSSNSKNHIDMGAPERSEGCGSHMPSGERQQHNCNVGVAVLSETVTSNPLHRRNPSRPISQAQESVVVSLNQSRIQQPAPARTNDNEAAILAEAKRILEGLRKAEAEKVAA